MTVISPPSPSAVLPWHTDPLTVSDLTRHKLIGLGRPERRKLENMVPSSVKVHAGSLLPCEQRWDTVMWNLSLSLSNIISVKYDTSSVNH